MQSVENQLSSAKKWLLVWLHVGFFLIGIVTVLLGQILPVLSARLSLDDSESSYLFIAQFAGSLTGTFFYNSIIKKFGYRKTLGGGFCLMAFGCAALGFDRQISAAAAAAIGLYGVGIGLTIPAINLLVIELNPKKSSSVLNIINFFWGFGAISCKPFVDYVGSPASVKLPTVLLAVSLLTIGAAIWFSNLRENFEKRAEEFSGLEKPIWTTRTAWLIAVFNFVHIGIESSVGGWITTFESRLPPSAAARGWLSAAFVFFSFLVLGRIFAAPLFRFLSEDAVLFVGLLMMSAGMILILRTENFSFLLTGAGILGLGSSSIFPTNMSRFTKIFGARATENAMPLFVFGSLGGALMTWFVGFVSTAFNNLRAGFSVILIGCFLLLILQTILACGKSK